MPNWEDMAGAMTQPFGGIEQPQQKPQFNMQEMARGFMDTLRGIGTAMAPKNVSKTMAQPLVNMPPQGMWDFLLGKVPPEMMNAPVGEEEKKQLTQKAYDWVEPHLFATGGLLAGVGAKMAKGGLSLAEQMAAKGDDVENIWQKTGWIKGKEGKWRFEIDDSAMKVNRIEGKYSVDNFPIDRVGEYKLSDVVSHPKLFEQYPELKNMKLRFSDEDLGKLAAYYDRNTDEIVFGLSKDRYGQNMDKFRSNLVHEIQHAIQDREGFARGTNSAYMTVKDELSSAFPGWEKMSFDEQTNIIKQLQHKKYLEHHGEFESRDSASRMAWGPEERKMVRPYSSEVEPQSGWILRGESGAAASTQSLMDSIRSLQPKGQERALVSISELRDKAVGGNIKKPWEIEPRPYTTKELKEFSYLPTAQYGPSGIKFSQSELDTMKGMKRYGVPVEDAVFAHERGHARWDLGIEDKAKRVLAEELEKIPLSKTISPNEKGIGERIAETLAVYDLVPERLSIAEKSWAEKVIRLSDKTGISKGNMTNAEFDAQLLKLAQEGKVFLHKHDFASSLKPEERAKLLAIPNKNAHWGGNDYYIGVVPK